MTNPLSSKERERLQRYVEVFLTDSKDDPTLVLLCFRHKEDNKLGIKITTAAKPQRHQTTTAGSSHQRTDEVTQTVRRRYRPPAAFIVNDTPRSNSNSNKRRRTTSATPSSNSSAASQTPPSVAPPVAPATPETLRDTATLDDRTEANISILSADNRDLSDNDEGTSADHQLSIESTQGTTSTFFHKNRYEPLLAARDEDNSSAYDKNVGIGDGNGISNGNGEKSCNDISDDNGDSGDDSDKCGPNKGSDGGNGNNGSDGSSGAIDDSNEPVYECKAYKCHRPFKVTEHTHTILQCDDWKAKRYCPNHLIV